MQHVPVSVVIPAYNAAWCIDRTLRSVFDQTLPPAEVIVVNDGSNDDTAAKVRAYGKRVRFIDQPNRGQCNARNTGIRAAREEWIAFLDADDYWLPPKLEMQMALISARPELGFCSTCARVESPAGEALSVWKCPDSEKSILTTIFERHAAVAGSNSAVLARRELLLRVGLFDETLGSQEDVDMWLRLAAISPYACIPRPLAVILRSAHSVSSDLDVMRDCAIKVMRKNRGLLEPAMRGAFWRSAYASVLADYAKWEYRVGKRGAAMAHLLEALARSPLRRGRLSLSLLVAMIGGQPL